MADSKWLVESTEISFFMWVGSNPIPVAPVTQAQSVRASGYCVRCGCQIRADRVTREPLPANVCGDCFALKR